ncbi:hypothetical protein HGRIS_001005 [Hohenbuehelia grisea]|uniref:BRCT domain-containing protein n=1 Tax=Hohenbuehelia grisea TaxID=104357 RepID=A0ABR3IQF0_9AGAR
MAMRRRTNKSAKVPNVKLRPAQAKPPVRTDSGICWAEDSQLGSDDTAVVDFCPRPFKGVVICATGVQDKPTLFKQALELGATSVQAFTDRVTHLVAVDHGGAKYTCAVERKIPILKPSWITECYQVWLRGDDVDVDAVLERHRLPVFSGVVLCPSGITSITQRTQINKRLTAQGGTYVKNLERPVKVTHLLCSGDEETDKMHYAEKFNRTGEAVPEIKLVWEEWFWDSLEFGGRFDEEKYQVTRPRPERKTAPEPPFHEAAASSVFESEPSALSQAPTQAAGRKLLAGPDTNEEEEEETASIKIIPELTRQLWGSLVRSRGFEINARGCLLRSPTKDRTLSAAAFNNLAPISDVDGAERSIIDRFRRANSFAAISATNANPESGSGNETVKRVFGRSRTIGALGGVNSRAASIGLATETSALSPVPEAGSPPPPADSATANLIISSNNEPDRGGADVEMGDIARVEAQEPVASGSGSGLFAGLTFRALGEARAAPVGEAIRSCGGRLVGDDDINVDYVLVRLVSGGKFFNQEPSKTERLKYRTECWLERCIFEERIVLPHENITFVPLGPVDYPIPGADRVVLGYSGLDSPEVCCLKRLSRALGFSEITGTFSRRATHLLCPSGAGAKYNKAIEWNIPVVSMSWVEEIIRTSRIVPVNGWLVGPDGKLLPAQEPRAESNDFPGKVDKGKGKAKALSDIRMTDITNTDSQSEGQSESPVDIPAPPLVTGVSQFGAPNGLLGSAGPGPLGSSRPQPFPLQHTNSSGNETPSSSSSNNLPKLPPSRQPTLPNFNPTPNPAPDDIAKSQSIGLEYITRPSTPRLTHRQVELERTSARIPSSKSPSPLKVLDQAAEDSLDAGFANTAPSSPTKDRRAAASPPKISGDAARVLQESITSLLGKRRDSPTDDVSTGQIGGAPGPVPGRAKRARPQRKTSSTVLKGDPVVPPPAHEPAGVAAAPVMVADPDNPFALFEGGDGESSLGGEDSVRVMYEDPRQREEKRKLLSLLNVEQTPSGPSKNSSNSGTSSGPKPRPRPRPKARAGGF